MAIRIVFGKVTMMVGVVSVAAICFAALMSTDGQHQPAEPLVVDGQDQLGASFAQTSRLMSKGSFSESMSPKDRSRLWGGALRVALSVALMFVALISYLGAPDMSVPLWVEVAPHSRRLSAQLQTPQQHVSENVVDNRDAFSSEEMNRKLAEDEAAVKSRFAEAQRHVERWQVEEAQKDLQEASERSLTACDHAVSQSQVVRTRLLRIEALTRLGQFLEANGRPTDAIGSLRRAVETSAGLAPIGAASDTVAVVARAEVALARALCTVGGEHGKAFDEAGRYLGLALHSVAHARMGQAAREFAPLAAEINAEIAACSYAQGKLATAAEEANAAMSIATVDVPDEQKRSGLVKRITKIQGSVKHDQGLFKDALRLYDESLAASGSLPEDTSASADNEVERLSTLQDIALAMAQDGRIDEGLERLDKVEQKLQAMNDKLLAKSGRQAKKFLAKKDIIDAKLWEEMARISTTRAELLLSRASILDKKLPIKARKAATEAVSMLREGDHKKALANALNTLGNVLSSIGRVTEAEPVYKEALELLSDVFGSDSPVVASLYDNLGMIADSRGDHKEALRLFQFALGIQSRTLGISNPDTAGSLTLIAANLEKHSKLPHAQVVVAATKALESAIKAYPAGHATRVEAEERLTNLMKADLTALLV